MLGRHVVKPAGSLKLRSFVYAVEDWGTIKIHDIDVYCVVEVDIVLVP